MENETPADRTRHLTDAELFAGALPAAGQPEALPAHLSECLACSRSLAEWKTAVRELASDDAAPIASRSPAEWTAAENRTLARLRRTRPRRPRMPLRWAVAAAAVLFVVALLLPTRRPDRSAAQQRPLDASELSAQDQADDALLRDVARLSRGEDGGTWNTLAPDPRTPAREEDRL
jgi:hypothetical protein